MTKTAIKVGYKSLHLIFLLNLTVGMLADLNSLCLIQVYLVTFLLRFLRRDRLASRIYTGWRAWVFGNKSRYDMNLFFSVDNVRAMESMLVDDEKEEIKLLVTPETHCWFR